MVLREHKDQEVLKVLKELKEQQVDKEFKVHVDHREI
jgi:ribosomal protein L29